MIITQNIANGIVYGTLTAVSFGFWQKSSYAGIFMFFVVYIIVNLLMNMQQERRD